MSNSNDAFKMVDDELISKKNMVSEFKKISLVDVRVNLNLFNKTNLYKLLAFGPDTASSSFFGLVELLIGSVEDLYKFWWENMTGFKAGIKEAMGIGGEKKKVYIMQAVTLIKLVVDALVTFVHPFIAFLKNGEFPIKHVNRGIDRYWGLVQTTAISAFTIPYIKNAAENTDTLSMVGLVVSVVSTLAIVASGSVTQALGGVSGVTGLITQGIGAGKEAINQQKNSAMGMVANISNQMANGFRMLEDNYDKYYILDAPEDIKWDITTPEKKSVYLKEKQVPDYGGVYGCGDVKVFGSGGKRTRRAQKSKRKNSRKNLRKNSRRK